MKNISTRIFICNKCGRPCVNMVIDKDNSDLLKETYPDICMYGVPNPKWEDKGVLKGFGLEELDGVITAFKL